MLPATTTPNHHHIAMTTTTNACRFRLYAVQNDGSEMLLTSAYSSLEALLRHADLRVEDWYLHAGMSIDYIVLEDDLMGDWSDTLREHVAGQRLPSDLVSWALELAS